MDDGRLEGSCAGVGRVQVEGVGVARQLSEQLHIAGGERFGEGRLLADVQQPAERSCCCDGREAQPRFITDFTPYEIHPEDDVAAASVQLQLSTVSCKREQERRHLRTTREKQST